MAAGDAAAARRAWPAAHAPALEALFSIDRAMGDVLRHARDPMVARIRLAWWREQLRALDAGTPSPAEPRLEAVQRDLKSKGVAASQLALLEDGWLALLDPFPWNEATAEAVYLRGRRLFGLAAMVMGRTGDAIEEAGGVWALGDAAAHCSDAASRQILAGEARLYARTLKGVRIDRALRPLSMMTAAALRDLAAIAADKAPTARGHALAMLRHRLTGRLTID